MIQILVRIIDINCVATITTKETSGMTNAPVNAFEMTVSASVTGSERQNRMLLSLRSAYRESRL